MYTCTLYLYYTLHSNYLYCFLIYYTNLALILLYIPTNHSLISLPRPRLLPAHTNKLLFYDFSPSSPPLASSLAQSGPNFLLVTLFPPSRGKHPPRKSCRRLLPQQSRDFRSNRINSLVIPLCSLCTFGLSLSLVIVVDFFSEAFNSDS